MAVYTSTPVSPMTSFGAVSPAAVFEVDYYQQNMEVLRDLQNGVGFFVVERYQRWSSVYKDNLGTMLLVTATGKAMPYRYLEILTGHGVLRGAGHVNPFVEEVANWDTYCKQQNVSYDDFEAFLKLVYQNQFLGFENLLEWEYNPFRLAVLILSGAVKTLTVSKKADYDCGHGDITVSTHGGGFPSALGELVHFLNQLSDVPLMDFATSSNLEIVAVQLEKTLRNFAVDVFVWRRPAATVSAGEEVLVVDDKGRLYKAEVIKVEYRRPNGFWTVQVWDPFADGERWFQFSEEPMELTKATWYDGGYARRA